MSIPFTKYHRAGNDFILIDHCSSPISALAPAQIALLCHRFAGIGADGLLLLESSAVADYKMRIFNSDGSEPAMCGNGILCLLDFIAHKKGKGPGTYIIETQKALLQGHVEPEWVGIDLPLPKDLGTYSLLPNTPLYVVDTGVPHGVLFVDDLNLPSFEETSRSLRYHPLFAPFSGINVNFVSQIAPGHFSARTYERGVEGETRSCGTGIAAIAWVALQQGLSHAPLQIDHFPGGLPSQDLSTSTKIRFNATTQILSLWGQPVRVFDGTY